jgi:hypothetical protein
MCHGGKSFMTNDGVEVSTGGRSSDFETRRIKKTAANAPLEVRTMLAPESDELLGKVTAIPVIAQLLKSARR